MLSDLPCTARCSGREDVMLRLARARGLTWCVAPCPTRAGAFLFLSPGTGSRSLGTGSRSPGTGSREPTPPGAGSRFDLLLNLLCRKIRQPCRIFLHISFSRKWTKLVHFPQIKVLSISPLLSKQSCTKPNNIYSPLSLVFTITSIKP
jgi:hypothetical protein